MRKSHLLLFIFTLLALFISFQNEIYASCGGAWFSTSCPVSPYNNPNNTLSGGLEAVQRAIGGAITTEGISNYAQRIVAYFMRFISVIAVIYIIYAGFQLMIGAGDEEKMKKTRQIILFIVVGITIMWLAYPIVKWTLGLFAYEGSLVPKTMAAYTESDTDTFSEYKNKIKEGLSQMENEFLLNRSVNISTIQNVKNLIQGAFDRLPDSGDAANINKEGKQRVDAYLDLAMKKPDNSNDIGNAVSRVSNFLDNANIGRISGNINAGPIEGNAPLSVSFRATDIKDPSGTTPSDNNYVWWTRENGGYRRELSRGPSMSYTFTKEGTYTVFLDVISGSRNSKGKIDVLPLSVSKQIVVNPKLGEIVLLINGVNASNMDTLKISPTIGKIGVILDASASRAIGNGTIAETKWEFGNGESSTNRGGPIVERQVYANQGGYILKLTMKTNDGQIFTKEIQLLVRDPSATIKLDKNTGHIGEEVVMSSTSYFSDTKNIEYTWQIQDENGKKIVKIGDGTNLKHKFETIGSYIITLNAKSPNGNIDTDSKIITIESREPIVTIDTPKPIRNDTPNTILFDASKSYDPDSNSRKNLSYTWKIDGEKITLDNLENNGAKGTYTFEDKGNHRVSLTVANAYGKITTIENQFEVTSTLSVNMIIAPRVVKRGEVITLIGQSENAEFFEWNMGDGSAIVSGTSRSVQHIYKQSGTYNVVLSVNRNGGSETNTINRKIYVSEADSPFGIIEVSNSSNSAIEEEAACGNDKALTINRADTTTLNAGNSINIDGTTTGLSYTWRYLGKARTTPSISEKFNELGCFPIELTVRSNKNGASHTTRQYIKLTNQVPEITNLTTTVDSTKKDSQKILVNVRANGAIDPDGVITSYIWYYKTESDPEPQNVQITQKSDITFVLPNITEKYYFGVILEDNDGAKMNSTEGGQSPTPLVIDNSNGNIYLPIITLNIPKTIVNVGEKVRFSAEVKTIVPGVNITNKSEYAWDFDGDGRIDEKSSLPSIEHTYNRSGDFNMKLRVTNNGVSNTKYQTIHVKNKLLANTYIYRLPDDKIYIMNASEGSYDRAHWEIGSIISESLGYVMLDNGSGITDGKLTISSHEDETSTTTIDISKAENISGSGLNYQSYPRSIDDVITVKNPGDIINISMLGNNADNYAIDTDIIIDTSLDGNPENDSDNKDDISYTDGSLYTIHDSGKNKREQKVRLALIKNGTVISTRTITIVYDYIASTIEDGTTLTGSGSAGLSTGDRNKLEDLSKMIRELTDSDRIILMQRYNTLVENWNNPFDKAKSLIDIQEGIDSGSMDNDIKTKLSKIIDELLIGDAQVTDEVGIATLLIKDLIPKESPNHDVLLEKLAEIESHPTLLDTNKKLGKEMLVLIENDTTIPDKYKGHIKNQLLVIINGGIKSIPTEAQNTTGGAPTGNEENGILSFISGFVKVFFIIIGIILSIGIIAFIFYRMTRKGDTIGFQDFLIDAVFHHDKAPPISESITKSDSIVEGAPPLPKEDPLSSYIPSTNHQPERAVDHAIETPKDPLNMVPAVQKSEETGPVIHEENMPDWLKAPVSTTGIDTTSIHSPTESSATIILPEETIPSTDIQTTTSPIVGHTPDENNIPDWIKNTSLGSNKDTKSIEESGDIVPPSQPKIIITPDEDKLPDWLIDSLQSEKASHTEEETGDTGEIIDTHTSDIQTEIVENTTPQEDTIPEKDIIQAQDGTPVQGIMDIKDSVKKPTKKQKMKPTEDHGTPKSEDNQNIPSWLK